MRTKGGSFFLGSLLRRPLAFRNGKNGLPLPEIHLCCFQQYLPRLSTMRTREVTLFYGWHGKKAVAMSKPALTYQQQLDQLKSRGLAVPDEAFARHILEHHNYYRLSAYRFSFTVPGIPDQFLPCSSFTQIWDL